MTPLEKAKAKERSKSISCRNCKKSERVNGVLYCQISGKIILPRFEDIGCCRGKWLKRSVKKNDI